MSETVEYRRLGALSPETEKELAGLYREAGWISEEDPTGFIVPAMAGSAVAIGAFCDGRLIGMGRAISDGVSDAFIQDVAVTKAFRRRGIGGEIVRQIAAVLKERGVDWIGLVGEPGTAKSWLSEHLCAAINGDSTRVIQGTAGTTEEQIRYSWNYALLIAEGPSERAMLKSPVYRAMEDGAVARFEEISRCASEVQDALISLLSEKRVSVPELHLDVPARKGFSLIATANTRDKGVNDMSSALKRRFNIVVLPAPASLEAEMRIVQSRVAQLTSHLDLNAALPAEDIVRKVCTIFRELRAGRTLDGSQKIKPTSGVLSTAEAISLLAGSMSLAGSFGDGTVGDVDLAAALQGAVIKEDDKDTLAWKEYLENIMKKRGEDWFGLYVACRELLP